MALSREKILKVARAQKLLLTVILLAIVIQIAMLPVRVAIEGGQVDQTMAAILAIGMLVFVVAMVVLQVSSVIRLCLAMDKGWTTGLYVILQFVPCLNLLMLLILNGQATKRLKESGIRVGLMGANSADLAKYQPQDSTRCPTCGEPIPPDATTCPMCGAEIAAPAI